MSYTIKVSADGKYIILKHWGVINSEVTTQRNLEAHALGAKLGISRHLVDVTEATHVDSATNTYKFAYDNMRTLPGINKKARVAVLVSPDDHSHDFVETVTRNAGQNVTLFRDREAAIKHLLAD
jgi:CBS-domain-containing membrane protein